MQDDILDFESKKKKKPKFIFSEADTNNCVEDSDTLDFGAKKKKKGVKIDLTDDSKLKKDEEFDVSLFNFYYFIRRFLMN